MRIDRRENNAGFRFDDIDSGDVRALRRAWEPTVALSVFWQPAVLAINRGLLPPNLESTTGVAQLNDGSIVQRRD